MKVYIVINFRTRRINQDTHKLAPTPILKKKTNPNLRSKLKKYRENIVNLDGVDDHNKRLVVDGG